MAVKLCSRGAPEEAEKPEVRLEVDYIEVARRAQELIRQRGWVALECFNLNGETIIVVSGDDVNGYPGGYPVYTNIELEVLTKADLETMLLLHESKKEGITITGVEEK